MTLDEVKNLKDFQLDLLIKDWLGPFMHYSGSHESIMYAESFLSGEAVDSWFPVIETYMGGDLFSSKHVYGSDVHRLLQLTPRQRAEILVYFLYGEV